MSRIIKIEAAINLLKKDKMTLSNSIEQLC